MAVLSLDFASGAFATSSVTLGSRQEMSRLRFCFDDLVAESGLVALQPRPRPLDLPRRRPRRRRAASPRRSPTSRPLPERFVGQFHRLHAALTDGGPLPVTLADARRSIELLTAAYYSAADRRAGRAAAAARPPLLRRLARRDETGGRPWLSLELRKVVKRFGAAEVIHGVDLTIEDGEFVVFVGPSGCGKSTLLRMIAGLEEISDGDVLIDGADGDTRCRRRSAASPWSSSPTRSTRT